VIYTNVSQGPLANTGTISSYHAPDPNRPALYENLARLIDEYQAAYYIIGRLHTTIFECAWALRGLEQLMLDMVDDPDLAECILEIPYQYHRVTALKMAAMGVDMLWLGDDVGSQKHMMISPKMWRRFLKPRMANLIADVKRINPGIKVAYHSDGSIYPILPELIEIGVDVLNPVQTESMDPAQLKLDFGDRLCFFGAIDVQTTLAFGSPEQVRQEVRQLRQTIGNGGGWICAPTHHVQLDTPMENFWALVDAIAEQ
jgi:uroporphyrinogen decarboxylase